MTSAMLYVKCDMLVSATISKPLILSNGSGLLTPHCTAPGWAGSSIEPEHCLHVEESCCHTYPSLRTADYNKRSGV